MFGYFGRYLYVDLTTRKISVRDLEENDLVLYIGGVGIAARILYDETTPETEPLAPENLLIAFTGPFTGTRVPSSCRHHIMARSVNRHSRGVKCGRFLGGAL